MHLETKLSFWSCTSVTELAILHVCKHTHVFFSHIMTQSLFLNRVHIDTITWYAGQCLERSNSPSHLLFWALWQRRRLQGQLLGEKQSWWPKLKNLRWRSLWKDVDKVCNRCNKGYMAEMLAENSGKMKRQQMSSNRGSINLSPWFMCYIV